MSEEVLDEEEVAPRRKRGLPGWLWFCGGGCLLALIAAIVLGFFAWSWWQQARDPEVQWPKIAQVLPYDHRPADWTLLGSTPAVGFRMWMFRKGEATMIILMQLPAEHADKTREEMLSEDKANSVFGRGGRKNMQRGKIDVQGRELDCLRFYQVPGLERVKQEERTGAPTGETSQEGASIIVDLTPIDAARPLFLQLIRIKSESQFTDDEVREMLKEFDIGPEHQGDH